jgi:hypothetical protein
VKSTNYEAPHFEVFSILLLCPLSLVTNNLDQKAFWNCFRKTIIHTNSFGYVVEDGKPEGLVHMMKYGEADVSISALKLNHHRIDMSDYCPVATWELRYDTHFVTHIKCTTVYQ